MQTYQNYYGPERRMYERKSASGGVTLRAYLENRDYYKSYYKDYYKDTNYYSDLYGSADMMDISAGGMRIKTAVPLGTGYMLEVKNASSKIALVRWVTKAENYYYAGLMYA